jgi:hypothetical protein
MRRMISTSRRKLIVGEQSARVGPDSRRTISSRRGVLIVGEQKRARRAG